jgi:hypothetical protein
LKNSITKTRFLSILSFSAIPNQLKRRKSGYNSTIQEKSHVGTSSIQNAGFLEMLSTRTKILD